MKAFRKAVTDRARSKLLAQWERKHPVRPGQPKPRKKKAARS